MRIRKSAGADFAAILEIVNDAAQAYRNVIPAGRWHEPYMPAEELAKEIADGVGFWVIEEERRLLGVMGIQDKGDAALVRHAYISPGVQRKGVGTMLLRHVESLAAKPVLIGTWAAASWAIGFYRRNGYTVLSDAGRAIIAQTRKEAPCPRPSSSPAQEADSAAARPACSRAAATGSLPPC